MGIICFGFEFYRLWLPEENYGSNMQIITHGEGTNNNQTLNLMGLNKNKGVIFSIISEENLKFGMVWRSLDAGFGKET